MSAPIKHILIVGGGSAGWLTAAILAARFQGGPSGVNITLVESPNVPTVGVGEGTWPSMRSTLQTIGLSETEFVRHCDAALKQGTWFKNWTAVGDQPYYHPFTQPAGFETVNLAEFWLQGLAGDKSFASAVSPQAAICDHNQAPKQIQIPEFAYTLNYGYHLDAAKFADLLKSHAVGQLGVEHKLADVIGVRTDGAGYIEALETEQLGALEADLFVDCSGFAGLLIDQHFNVPLTPQDHILFNDRALAVQVPYPSESEPIATSTKSTAQKAGWIWDIGLQHRRGVGHVFSSRFQSEDETYGILEQYLKDTGRAEGLDDLSPRLLEFEAGYRERFWVKNCVAIGLSGGFIEPLEASALVLIELSAQALADRLPANREVMRITANRFNTEFTYRWEQIIDFLKLHYLLSQRTEPYWVANCEPESISESLRDKMSLWQHQVPWYHDDFRRDEMFPAASYQYVMFGMGFRPDGAGVTLRSEPKQKASAQKLFQDVEQLTQRYRQHLPNNRALMSHLQQVPFGRTQ